MSVFNSFDISASGLSAQRFRMDIISQNLANATTTRTDDGTPYRRKIVTFQEKNNTPFSSVLKTTMADYTGSGVKVNRVAEDYETDMVMAYDPAHPDADENGYVTMPNVNIITEMTNMIDSSRSYEANVTAFTATKTMMAKALEMGK